MERHNRRSHLDTGDNPSNAILPDGSAPSSAETGSTPTANDIPIGSLNLNSTLTQDPRPYPTRTTSAMLPTEVAAANGYSYQHRPAPPSGPLPQLPKRTSASPDYDTRRQYAQLDETSMEPRRYY